MSTLKEHYWAIDCNGRKFEGAGDTTHVQAAQDLEARFDTPNAEVYYHHSHPDERALRARAQIGDSQQTNREVGKKATNRRGRFR